jgi:NAD(P)-dependent dehydrogenase (short-subunit alcohol dehydrogenase family)
VVAIVAVVGAPTLQHLLVLMSTAIYVVTGGGSGLGAATVARLDALPSTLVFSLDIAFPVADQHRGRHGHGSQFNIPCDVSNALMRKSRTDRLACVPGYLIIGGCLVWLHGMSAAHVAFGQVAAISDVTLHHTTTSSTMLISFFGR